MNRRQSIKSLISWIVFCPLFFLVTSCSRPAPISTSFRQSALDSSGLVLIVNNTGNGRLSCRMIAENKILNQKSDYAFDLGPNNSTEIGLLEAGWTFKTGESVTIYVEGYASHSIRVP